MNCPPFDNTLRRPVALVTGGAGFLGSHVCDRLLAGGSHVVCVDNFLSGRRLNIAHLLKSPYFTVYEGDISEGVPQIEVDEIWNLACPASPPTYQVDPVHTMLTSVLGMKHCLDLAVRTGARVFQASTSEVYGDPDVHPQPESYRGNVNTIGPRACYDEGKRAAETLCMDYRRMYGVDVRIARIFNTYGPRMSPHDGRVVSNFIVNALTGKMLELYGDGLQTRSFCYVDDLVEGFFRLMRYASIVDAPVNIGNPGEFTMKQLAELVLAISGAECETTTVPLPVDDPKQRRPDITVAKSLLGWEPKVQLQQGLAATIDYFRDELWLASLTEECAA
jgi:UDP-glucuronate decarboxylase